MRSSKRHKSAGSDGKDVGADVAAVNAAIAGARQGIGGRRIHLQSPEDYTGVAERWADYIAVTWRAEAMQSLLSLVSGTRGCRQRSLGTARQLSERVRSKVGPAERINVEGLDGLPRTQIRSTDFKDRRQAD